MNELQTTQDLSQIVIHFNTVDEHKISLNTFLESANAFDAAISCINEKIYNSKIKYKIMVRPPVNGSFIEILEVTITNNAGEALLALGGAFTFANTPVGAAYIKGLTGKSPIEIATSLGKKTKEYLLDENSGTNFSQNESAQEFLSAIFAQTAIGFMKKTTEELKKIGVHTQNHREAFAGKNKFYETLIKDNNVKDIGFNLEEKFDLKRSEFLSQIVILPQEDEENTEDWVVENENIVANSPNWNRDGRKWQARCSDGSDVWFKIEDDTFWYYVDQKKIHPETNDSMYVQWAYPANKNRSNLKVLKVITYNGNTISQPLSETELLTMLGNYTEKMHIQPDLFTPPPSSV